MRYFLFMFLPFLFVNCASKEEENQQPSPDFTLEGKIAQPQRNFMILYQQNDIEKKESTVVDTILLDETGRFHAEFDLAPHYYSLEVDEKKSIPLVLDKGQIVEIEVNKNHQSVKGSKDTELYLAYEKYRASSLQDLVKSVRKSIAEEQAKEKPNQEKIDSLGSLEISNYDQHLSDLNTYLKENIGASLALYPTSIRWKGEENLELYDSLVKEVESQYSELEITKRLREKVARLSQTSIGGVAPNISMETIEGKEVSLFDLHDEYTLIEFWASWCGPCRRESGTLNNLYEKYKNQGFDIYAVSLDRNRKQWLNATKIDQREYTNVSSLEGFKTPAAYDYAVTALPMNYIIDQEGEIIAKDIHGEELIQFIETLM